MSLSQKKARACRIEREIEVRISKLAMIPRGYRRKEQERITKLRTEAVRLAA